MTKTDETLERFRNLNVWKRGDVRAPHKPLLVLLALGRLQAGSDRLLPYDEIDQPLTRLLEDFGPPRKSPHPELPFFHLQTDGVWEIEDRVPLRIRKGSKNPLKSDLKRLRIAGGFTDEVFRELKRRPELVRQLARQILTTHFPESLHESICSEAGVELGGTERSNRDPAFRSAVISVWSHRCAFCGFGIQLDGRDLALEAAHIRWCQAGGPDSLSNGLACCSVHHQAFDRGAITVSDERRILVSSRLHGSGRLDELFLSLHGAALGVPSRKEALPDADSLAWHRTQVFRGEARD
ncbi:MAG: HNH endonuclease [Acidobacteriaceae bacterium]|nr:HNH endonuclease [Acidobacteriaceae bacterium]